MIRLNSQQRVGTGLRATAHQGLPVPNDRDDGGPLETHRLDRGRCPGFGPARLKVRQTRPKPRQPYLNPSLNSALNRASVL